MCQKRITEDCFLLNCSEFRSNDSTGIFSKRPLPKSKPQAGPTIFGPIISKSTQRLGACGDRYPRVHKKARRSRERLWAHYFARPSLRGPGEELLAEWIDIGSDRLGPRRFMGFKHYPHH
jgi:hypothetical protein